MSAPCRQDRRGRGLRAVLRALEQEGHVSGRPGKEAKAGTGSDVELKPDRALRPSESREPGLR